MTCWDPQAYLRFGDQRTRAAVDLAHRIAVEEPRTVIDLGCGPGNSTKVLRQRWPRARIVGLDSSASMIAAAEGVQPGGEWIQGRIEHWTADQPFDVVFSNAALQWTRDHGPLTQRLLHQVAPGGALAFQIPSGEFSPVRRMIHEVSHDPAWTDRMHAARGVLTMESPARYYDALSTLAASIDMWETEYHHVLDSQLDIVRWMASTGLRPFLEALDSDDQRNQFRQMLAERLPEAYPIRADGRVLFPFKRTFVIAYVR